MNRIQKNIFLILLLLLSSLSGSFSKEINSFYVEFIDYNKIIAQESIAYLLMEDEGSLQLLDCSNAMEPNFTNEVLVSDDLFGISYFVLNDILYYCVNDIFSTYLMIIDVNDPQNLVPLGYLELECSFYMLDSRIYVENEIVYILSFSLFCESDLLEYMGNSALLIINCTNFSQLKLEQTHYFSFTPYINIFVKNESIFLLKNYKTNATGFDIIDAVDNSTLLTIGGWSDSLLEESIIIDSFFLNNESLCIAHTEGLMMFSIANESSPELTSTIHSDIFINDVCLSNSNLFAIGNNTIEIYSVEDIGNLFLINEWNFVDDIYGYFYDGDISDNFMYVLRYSNYDELYFLIIDFEDVYNPEMMYPSSDLKDKYMQIPPMTYIKWVLGFSLPLVLVGIILFVRRIKSKA